MHYLVKSLALVLTLGGVGLMPLAHAVKAPDQGKLLLTGGVSALDGASGGGLSTWALIGGYGTRDSYGIQVRHTEVFTQDYRLTSPGITLSVADRAEFSYARLRLDERGGALEGSRIELDSFGVKLKVFGDAVVDQDRPWPQVSIGVQHKSNKGISGLGGLGIRRATDIGASKNRGTDFYIAATKLYLNHSVLLNGTVRFTEANQYGLAGFGGDRKNGRKAQFEGAVGWLLRQDVVVGAEFRSKPRNLSIDDEKDAYSVYAAWAPNKHAALTLAYVDLGPIISGTSASPINPNRQQGIYLSVQFGY